MSDSSNVTDKKKTPAQQAVDARPPFNGPHRKIKKAADGSGENQDPAYVVVVKQKPSEDVPPAPSFKYDPGELRAKARGLLQNRNISPEQKEVLAEILGPEKNNKGSN